MVILPHHLHTYLCLLQYQVIRFTAWQLLGNLVDQVNVVQSQLPYLELFELKGIRLSSLVLRPYLIRSKIAISFSSPPAGGRQSTSFGPDPTPH